MKTLNAQWLRRIGLGALVALILIASTLDHEIEVAADDQYRDMVCSGHWPDYESRSPQC